MAPNTSPKRKMQRVTFANVTECLDFLQGEELKITELLRRLIFECVPDIEEKLSYNVPFYRRNAGMFFIWPGSIDWGNVSRPGVRFGFQSGYLLHDEIGYLDRGGRKQVYWRDFFQVADVDIELLKAYIYEAVLVDDEKPRRNRGLGGKHVSL